MNDQIKEILDNLDKIAKGEYYPEDLLSYKECKQLLDYIEELEKRVKDLCIANLRIDVIHSTFLPEDTPLVVMTKENFDRQEQTAQDENIILRQRISKAINSLSKGEPIYKIMEILEGEDE